MTLLPPHLVPVPGPDENDQPEPAEIRAPLSGAQLRQALTDAGHPSTAPDIRRLYLAARPDEAIDLDDR